MGGLAVNVSHLHDRIRKLILTPNGVLHLAQKGHFLEISEKDVKDKSKASWFTKALVVLQILWTILQCLYRKAAGFPLSVLEIHTLVHAGCALIMYSLWFHKPLDVEEPLTISNDGINHYIALMLVQTYNFGTQPFGNLVLPLEFQPAKLSGSRFGDWPGHQGSEAMYLMFRPPDQDKFANAKSSGFQDTGDDPSVHNGSNLSPSPNKYKGIIADHSTNHVDAVSNQVWTVDLSLNRTISDQDLDQGNLLRHQFGNSRIKAFAPGVGHRRREAHVRKARLAKRGERLGQVVLGSKGELSGVQSGPPDGIEVVASFSTGQFTSNGIGPAAFLTGPLRQQYQLDDQPPPGIVEVPQTIRDRLPLGQCNVSSIAHYLPLKINLSQKDERRWNLAGLALQEEYSAGNLHPPPLLSQPNNDSNPTYIDFSNRASTLNTSYFTTHSALLRLREHIFAEAYPATYGSQPNTNRGIVFLRGIYHRLLEAEELKLGATSAVLMLPGIFYGGLHLALWFYDFPTTAEGLLWKISAVTLIAVPVLLALPFAGWAAWRRSGNRKDTTADSKQPPAMSKDGLGTSENTAEDSETKIPTLVVDSPPVDSRNVTASLPLVNEFLLQLAIVAVVLIATLYIFARVFIIVESFISLRHVPLGVYTDVGWPKYIPHL